MNRNRPPDRRPTITRRVTWQTDTAEHRFNLSIGYDPATNLPIEVFYADGQKTGTSLRDTVQDACVLISLLLQYGATPADIGKSLSTAPVFGETKPATMLGVIAEAIQEEGD